jgi:hypothetical protein
MSLVNYFPQENLDRSPPESFFELPFFSFLTISPTPFEGRKIHVSRAIDSPFEILEKNMCIEWGLCCNSFNQKDPTLVAAEVLN